MVLKLGSTVENNLSNKVSTYAWNDPKNLFKKKRKNAQEQKATNVRAHKTFPLRCYRN